MKFHIFLIAAVLASGCTQVTDQAETTTVAEEFCNAPYIRLGKGCCLDKNENNVCDKDEAKEETTLTPTTAPTTTTLTEETTTTVPTTTTTLSIKCSVNSDCGESKEHEICHNGDLYMQRITPLCKKPGTPESYCIQKQSWVGGSMVSEPSPSQDCYEGCKDNKCI